MKGKTLKSIVASILSVAMLMSFAACGEGGSEKDNKNDSADASASDNADMNSDGKSTIDKNVKVGDYVTFGSYEQDNDTSNGKEPIEWLVLDVQDGKALIISNYALDCKPYNKEFVDITWESSTLRSWLNNDFYNLAFSSSEKGSIATTTVIAEDNAEYGTEAGVDTQDKVFLLSISEAEKYFSSNDERVCKPTQYAVEQGVNVFGAPDHSCYGNCFFWWLRSPGERQDLAAVAFYDGSIMNIGGVDGDGGGEDDGLIAVRPAMWVTIG